MPEPRWLIRPTEPLTLCDLEQTCGMCPSQWEARTPDGRFVYIRYRHEELTVGVGADWMEAVDASAGYNGKSPYLWMEWEDGGSGGYMSTEKMLQLTGFAVAKEEPTT